MANLQWADLFSMKNENEKFLVQRCPQMVLSHSTKCAQKVVFYCYRTIPTCSKYSPLVGKGKIWYLFFRWNWLYWINVNGHLNLENFKVQEGVLPLGAGIPSYIKCRLPLELEQLHEEGLFFSIPMWKLTEATIFQAVSEESMEF